MSVGLLGAVWSSSAAMVAIINAMNKALTIGLALSIVLSFGLIIGGPQLADWLAAGYALSGWCGVSERKSNLSLCAKD